MKPSKIFPQYFWRAFTELIIKEGFKQNYKMYASNIIVSDSGEKFVIWSSCVAADISFIEILQKSNIKITIILTWIFT